MTQHYGVETEIALVAAASGTAIRLIHAALLALEAGDRDSFKLCVNDLAKRADSLWEVANRLLPEGGDGNER